MAWTYDGQCLEWTYEPPLESGQTILYTREWDQVVTPDSSGLRDVLITAAPTSNASIVFATKDVDIISSSLPLGSALDYHGNLSNPPYGIRYSSRFKLYNLTWFCGVENLGSDSSDIALDISVPCNTEFQHTIIEPEGDFTVDDLGNRRLILNMVLPPRACINITLEFSILVQTWPEGWGFASGRIDPERFLGSDPRFWQLDDPRIRAFASQAVAGMTDAREMAMALAEAISDHLTYSQIPERKGALWALLNRMGSCREYADLLIACARCQGIPALYVSGLSGSSANDSAGHAWIALWLEGIGWVGLDPGWGYTGLLDSARIVTGFCDPEDVDMLLTYKGGNTTIPYWTIDWSFEEVETARANAILGVADVTGLQTWTTLVGLAFLRESQRRIGASVEG